MGVVVAGRLTGFAGRHALFAADLDAQLHQAEWRQRRTLAQIDAHIARSGAPAVPETVPPLASLGLGPAVAELGARMRTVLWATGYRRTYPWLDVPVLDDAGELVHREGVTAAPGLYALGLRFQRLRKSHFVGGVGDDAAHIAEAILARSRASVPVAA